MKVTKTDCRSEVGITVGLIDSIITLSRLLSHRDLSGLEAQEALKDLRCDQDFLRVADLCSEIERQAAQFKEWQASHHANYCAVAEERDELKTEKEALRTEIESVGNELVETELRATKFYHRFVAACDLSRELRVALEAIVDLSEPGAAAKIAHDALEPFRVSAAAKAAAASKEASHD